MKKILFFSLILIFNQIIKAQQNYCDFEGYKVINFEEWNGTLDSLVSNPFPNAINNSANCAKYIRDTAFYDNIKFFSSTKLTDVSPYANNSNTAAKMTMKLYSTAPIGTIVQLQLGASNNNTYPAGIHSEYIATTSSQNAWELITFSYFQSPPGSQVASTNIDKIVLLFHPGSHINDTIYFDDLSGPPLINTGIPTTELSAFKLSQNYPNPAKENTRIRLQLNSSGPVSLKLYDVLGNAVFTLLDQNMPTGTYSVPVETGNIPDGVYFYVLKKDGITQTMRMIISK